MTIELDKRIPNKNCIFTCFDKECAKPYMGKQGYFTNRYRNFSNLKNCTKGILTAIADDSIGDSYCANRYFFTFFIPEECLKPEEEEKLKPYSLLVQLPFTIGDVILLRGKNEFSTVEECACTSISIASDNTISFISFGTTTYTPKELLEDYEWKSARLESTAFISFGVKE